jgi:hypothetical protein
MKSKFLSKKSFKKVTLNNYKKVASKTLAVNTNKCNVIIEGRTLE